MLIKRPCTREWDHVISILMPGLVGFSPLKFKTHRRDKAQ